MTELATRHTDFNQETPSSKRLHSAIPISPFSALLLAATMLMALLAFTWPLIFRPDAGIESAAVAPFVMALFMPIILVLVLTQLANGELDVKALAMLGVLTAVGAVARPLGAGTAGIETVFFLILVSGRVFGPGFGFILGNSILFASALITGGVGTWLPYQMLAAGWVGFGAGCLPQVRGKIEIVMLAAYGAIAALLYGAVMDFAFWPFTAGNASLGYDAELSSLENMRRFLIWHGITAMGWDTGRAISNILLVSILGYPVMQVLRRGARRAWFRESKVVPASESDSEEIN